MINTWIKEDNSNVDWKLKHDALLQEYEQSIKDFEETMEKSYEEAYAMILDLRETISKLEEELRVYKNNLDDNQVLQGWVLGIIYENNPIVKHDFIKEWNYMDGKYYNGYPYKELYNFGRSMLNDGTIIDLNYHSLEEYVKSWSLYAKQGQLSDYDGNKSIDAFIVPVYGPKLEIKDKE